ncbi:hypothetical protein [Jiangella asiatica]|uniref:Tetratricopeptide repeat protein n=1 Tax=Jiangella asiatica TaxID=2530372 RepID=A0A4R5DB84_9ACTN|nr:hypothetical protein [Jiangella asiatica]TDE10932.1 hypothetical protein E1269_10645 [Jiangella asiatica]
MSAHGEFIAYLEKRGIEHSGAALRPSTTATTLRPPPGLDDLLVTDGPDVELKEGRTDEAAAAYRRAAELTANDVERAFLLNRAEDSNRLR